MDFFTPKNNIHMQELPISCQLVPVDSNSGKLCYILPLYLYY